MGSNNKSKSLLDKVEEAVDHFINPDHVSNDELDSKGEQKKTDKKVKSKTSQIKDLKLHPKFAKFKQEKK